MKLIYVSVFLFCLSSCEALDLMENGKLTSPHEAFVKHYSYYVGKDILSNLGPLRPLEQAFEHDEKLRERAGLNGFRKLPDGNWELEWSLYPRHCLVFYEYDPDKRIVLNWRFEGSNEDCVQNPYN